MGSAVGSAVSCRAFAPFLALAFAASTMAGCANFMKGDAPDEPGAAKPASSAPPHGQRSPRTAGSSSESAGVASRPAASPASSESQSATPSPVAAAPVPAGEPPPPLTPLQAQLNEAIRQFDEGDFYVASARLRNLPDLASASLETRMIAMKYLAFSYCVTARRTLCRREFESMLKLDPKFELAPAERNHPIWKAEFENARKVMERAAAAKKKPAAKSAAKAKAGAKSTSKSASPRRGDAPAPVKESGG